jgi:hypothetical protein
MEIFEKESSIIRDSERVKENLRKELTDKLDIVAKNKINLIREIARKEVSQFLITWFPKSYIKNIDSENLKLKLIFNDEREINVVNNINSHIE